jgi:hypothetical protein
MKILINHVGYISHAAKRAVLQGVTTDNPGSFSIIDSAGGLVYRGESVKAGEVADWKTGCYWTLDFSSVENEGRYIMRVDTGNGTACSDEFEIRRALLTMRLLSAACYYFKAQRSSGEWLYDDRNLPFMGDRQGRIDAHGGWYDATGDYGIHFSQLSHCSLHNPQQVPFSTYMFFKVHEFLETCGNEGYSMVKRRLLDEGSIGVDFLMRMRAPEGGFFGSINQQSALIPVVGSRVIGFEYRHSHPPQFSKAAATSDAETITDVNYEVSIRSGGGLAVAALAIAARHFYPGRDYSSTEYIAAARDAWAHLEACNEKYTNDGEWNLIDEYCALIALTELYRTTAEYGYLERCREMYGRMRGRMEDQGGGKFMMMVKPRIPFYNAADEGMPVVALLQYAEIEPSAEKRCAPVADAECLMRRLLDLNHRVVNPFDYPRLECPTPDGKIKTLFFFPHNSTAAPWWQGDNARIASLSAAASLLANAIEDEKFAVELRRFSQSPLDWILGLNPFDSCMMEGYGKNNIQYFFRNRYDFLNCPGGIVNGITGGLEDEEGIEFVTEPGGPVDDNWRWAEQWIPHVSWFMYALALKAE